MPPLDHNVSTSIRASLLFHYRFYSINFNGFEAFYSLRQDQSAQWHKLNCVEMTKSSLVHSQYLLTLFNECALLNSDLYVRLSAFYRSMIYGNPIKIWDRYNENGADKRWIHRDWDSFFYSKNDSFHMRLIIMKETSEEELFNIFLWLSNTISYYRTLENSR